MKIDTLELARTQSKSIFKRFDGRTLFLSLFLALITFLVFTPLLFLLYGSIETVRPDGTTDYSLAGWRQAFANPGIIGAIYYSFALAIARQLIAIVIGVFLAWLIARTDIPLRGWLEFSFWLSYFIPSLPIALGWILLLDPKYGLINQWLMAVPFITGPLFNVYSFWGIVWVHLSASTIAIKVMLLTPAFRNLDAALEEASHVAGAGALKTLLRIAVPIMMPTILVALILGLIRSLEAFEIELILGRPIGLHVFSTKIYSFMTIEPPQYAPASALGSFFLIVLGMLVAFQRLCLRERMYTTVTGRGFSARPIRLGSWRYPALGFVAVVSLCITVMPLASLFLATFMKLFGYFHIADPWTLENWQQVLKDPILLRSLQNTFVLGISAAALGILLSSLIAYIIVKTKFFARGFLDFISWIPWSIPGILLGMALASSLLLIHTVVPLYGTMTALVFAMAIAGLPLTVQVIKSFLMQFADELEEASQVAGASWLTTFRRILLPLLLPCMIVVGLLEFIASARNISTVVLLATGKTRTLALLMLDYTAGAELEKATVVGAIIVLMVLAAAIVARVLGGKFGIR
ncbi:MAG: ABC-type Fe3+ transport system permease component [Deltaproteobacteria bacterium]|nr:ABC-type Fe3+ transport system permease component [Deltaproteobacteria bacterium]